jgi:hypothetical protein
VDLSLAASRTEGMRVRLLLLIAVFLALPPAAAAGDGPPTEVDAGSNGVVDASTGERLTATPAGMHHTVLARSQVAGGRVWQTAVLKGRWGCPIVAFDGTSGGLAPVAERLVLMQPSIRADREVSRFLVVGSRWLRVRQAITLRGHWNFDALSPDGSTLYLIQSLSRKDATRYAVRAYDLRAHRLLPKPIVDPSEPDEPMRGYPITRVTGPEGRWEYTLYLGGDEPFIHALDTVKRTSICIDLPHTVKNTGNLKLRLRGEKIVVVHGDRTIATTARNPTQSSAGGGPPWVAALLVATGLLAAAGVRRANRTAHPRR